MRIRSAATPTTSDWPDYLKQYRYDCPGPLDATMKPRKLTIAKRVYTHQGYKLVLDDKQAGKGAKVGVISASKEMVVSTLENIKAALAWFKKEQVHWIIVNGDMTTDAFDIETLFGLLGDTEVGVLVNMGNGDSFGVWNRIFRRKSGQYPNVINASYIRHIVADGVEFWILPGYYDKRFLHQTGACRYNKKDVQEMKVKLRKAGDKPTVLVSHGPPRGYGREAIDWISEGENIGDIAINKLLQKHDIKFGLFSHILEAGGKAVGSDFKTAVGERKGVQSLYVNTGSISGDPWPMNSGKTSYGMAAIVEYKNENSKFWLKRFPSRH